MMIKCSKEHLKIGGRLIIDNSIPPIKEMIDSNGKQEILEFIDNTEGTVIKDYFLPTYDFVNNIEYDEIKLEEYKNGLLINSEIVKEKSAFYYPRELRYIILENDMEIEQELGSLKKGTPLDSKSKEMVLICRKTK
jgi:hypothetical protein